MTIVSLLSRQRRVLVLCAATVALHYVTIDWLADRIGRDGTREMPVPANVSVQLRPALPPRAPVQPPPAEPAPAPQPAPKPKRASPPPVPASATAIAPVAIPEPDPAPAPAAPADVLDVPPPAPVAPPAEAGAAAAPVPVQSAAQAEAGRRYRVNVPPPASFELDVQRTDKDGTRWSGVASMRWETDGSRYKVGLDVGIKMLIARVDLLNLTSEGTIDDAGIAPVKMTEKRRSRSMTATHFDHDGRRITFSASTGSAPLLTGAQDKASVPFQLAAIGRADVNQFGSDIDIQVGEDRAATVYRFQLVGEEELDTPMGRLVTWRLARPPRPGSYSARLDIWLAPSLDWYPVRIRNTEGNGAVTTQTVTKILRPAQ